ncbi:MAG: deoxyribose-phosphate aldolase [Candidatus Babeliales bacterium]
MSNNDKNFASYLDFACHGADTTQQDIEQLCHKVLNYEFNSAYVNPCYIREAKNIVRDQSNVGTVVSFPLGQDIFSIKVTATKEALLAGADELDVVLNIGYIKEHLWEKCYEEMKILVKTIKDFDSTRIVKFIPETGYLTSDEIKKIAELMVKSGADFFKTCSGYGPRGATLQDVHLIRAAVGDAIKIKVAGGIFTYEQAADFIQAGVNRIGTSHAVEIIEGYQLSNKKLL